MKKNVYIVPKMEITELGIYGSMMKDLNEASMPAHMAPERRVPALSNDSIRVF